LGKKGLDYNPTNLSAVREKMQNLNGTFKLILVEKYNRDNTID
jgi:hypothetical protein